MMTTAFKADPTPRALMHEGTDCSCCYLLTENEARRLADLIDETPGWQVMRLYEYRRTDTSRRWGIDAWFTANLPGVVNKVYHGDITSHEAWESMAARVAAADHMKAPYALEGAIPSGDSWTWATPADQARHQLLMAASNLIMAAGYSQPDY